MLRSAFARPPRREPAFEEGDTMNRALVYLVCGVAVLPWACSSGDEVPPGTSGDGGTSPGVDTGPGPSTDTGADTTPAPDASTPDSTGDVGDAGINDAADAADAFVACAPPGTTPTPLSGDVTTDTSLGCDHVYAVS